MTTRAIRSRNPELAADLERHREVAKRSLPGALAEGPRDYC
jgi:hypothetical protein